MKKSNLERLVSIASELDEFGFHNLADEIELVLDSESNDDYSGSEDKEIRDLTEDKPFADVGSNEVLSVEDEFYNFIEDMEMPFDKISQECREFCEKDFESEFSQLNEKEKNLICADLFVEEWFPQNTPQSDLENIKNKALDLNLSLEDVKSVLFNLYLDEAI